MLARRPAALAVLLALGAAVLPAAAPAKTASRTKAATCRVVRPTARTAAAKARARARAKACVRARAKARAKTKPKPATKLRPKPTPHRAPASPARTVPPVAAPASQPAVLAASPAPAAPAAPTAPGHTLRYFGFNDNAVRWNQLSATRDAELTRGAGANVSRITFDWRWVEAHQGQPDFTAYDAIYRALHAQGIRPVWIILFAPQWAFDPGVSCNQWAADCRYPPARSHLDAWRSIVARVAQRYPESAAIEVWNEPNLSAFWKPAPDVARYTELLRAAHDAVHAVAPGMPVLGGSLGNNQITTAGGDVSLSDFLAGMYADGAKGAMDGISFHPYPWAATLLPGGLFDRSFLQVRTLRARYGDDATPLWVTETGVSTTGTDARYRFSEDQQAATSVALLRAAAAMPDVEAVMLHTLVEPPFAATDINEGYGVLRADLEPKAAYCAIARERGATGCG